MNNKDGSGQNMKPRVDGKVFTMSSSKVMETNEPIQGKCIMDSRLLDILLDSSAIHSFISNDRVESLKLPKTSLTYEVVVVVEFISLILIITNHKQCKMKG